MEMKIPAGPSCASQTKLSHADVYGKTPNVIKSLQLGGYVWEIIWAKSFCCYFFIVISSYNREGLESCVVFDVYELPAIIVLHLLYCAPKTVWHFKVFTWKTTKIVFQATQSFIG